MTNGPMDKQLSGPISDSPVAAEPTEAARPSEFPTDTATGFYWLRLTPESRWQAVMVIRGEDVLYAGLSERSTRETFAITYPNATWGGKIDPPSPDKLCVCGHPRSKHSPRDGVLACTIEYCACGPGCIHDGYVPADGSDPNPLMITVKADELESLLSIRARAAMLWNGINHFMARHGDSMLSNTINLNHRLLGQALAVAAEGKHL